MVCLLVLTLAVSAIVYAAEYQCIGERIERNGSTWGYARASGSDYRIEKGSSTVAFVKQKGGGKWMIEDQGNNTIGWLDGSSIEKVNGSSWASLSDAKSLCGGPDPVAAAIWVLNQNGKL